jgi:hypothetical protein
MATQANDTVPDWIALFVEAAQAERQRREEHTADTQLSIEQYEAAAERKIRDALGPRSPALLAPAPGRASSSLAIRPRTRAR